MPPDRKTLATDDSCHGRRAVWWAVLRYRAGSASRRVGTNGQATDAEGKTRQSGTATATSCRDLARGRRQQLSRLRAELLAAPANHSILLVRASGDEALDLVALELALAVEKSGQKVVVVDADLTARVLSSQLGFDQLPGVRDILAGGASIREVAHALGRTGDQ